MKNLEQHTTLRERKEKEIITQYDPIARDMTIVDDKKEPFTGAFNQTHIEYPLRVVLEIESFCNLRCKYCSEGESPPRIRIAKGTLQKLIDEVEELQIPELTIRGGEATIHPDFKEIWDYATRKNYTSTNLITNGFVFNPDKVRGMLENERSKIIVSLDGFSRINDFYRDPKQFKKVLSWLEPMLKEKPNQLVLLSVIYRQNVDALPEFARAMAYKGLEFFHLSPLKRLGRSEIADENFVSYQEINDLQSTLEDISHTYATFKPTVSCTALDKFKVNKTNHIPMPFFTEMHFGSGVKITPDGRVMVNRGIMFTDLFKNKYQETACLEPLGSIYDGRTFAQIWQESKDLRIQQDAIANKHYAYYLGWLKSLEK